MQKKWLYQTLLLSLYLTPTACKQEDKPSKPPERAAAGQQSVGADAGGAAGGGAGGAGAGGGEPKAEPPKTTYPTTLSGLDSLVQVNLNLLAEIDKTSAEYKTAYSESEAKLKSLWASYKSDATGLNKFCESIAKDLETLKQSSKSANYKGGYLLAVKEQAAKITSSQADSISTVAILQEKVKALAANHVSASTTSDAYKTANTATVTQLTTIWNAEKSKADGIKLFCQQAYQLAEKSEQSSESKDAKLAVLNTIVNFSSTLSTSTTTVKTMLWTTTQFDLARKTCWESALKTNPQIDTNLAFSQCHCLMDDAARRWAYDEYLRNEAYFTQVQISGGVLKNCNGH